VIRLLADLALAVGGVILLVAAGVAALCVLLSYVRSPAGQHKGAGEGALTVAALQMQHDQEQSKRAETRKAAVQADIGLFGLNLVSGYVTAGVTGKHHAVEIPGPSDWTMPTALEQTREIPVAEASGALVGAA
jgi:hypothetical protein